MAYCLTFDQNTPNISLCTAENLMNHLTISAWIKLENKSQSSSSGSSNLTVQDYTIIGQNNNTSSNEALHFIVRNNHLHCGFHNQCNQNVCTEGTHEILSGKWYHVAMVYEAGTGKQSLYVNGHLDGMTEGRASLKGSSNTVFISKFKEGRNFCGRLSFLRMWKYYLNEDNIRNIMYNGGEEWIKGISNAQEKTLDIETATLVTTRFKMSAAKVSAVVTSSSTSDPQAKPNRLANAKRRQPTTNTTENADSKTTAATSTTESNEQNARMVANSEIQLNIRFATSKFDASVPTRDKYILIETARLGDNAKLQQLLQQPDVDVNFRNVIDGKTALSVAAGAGHLETMKLLMSHGADINNPTCSPHVYAPLLCAAESGQVAAIDWLVTHGALLNVCNHASEAPLHIACAKNQFIAAKKLLDLHSDVNVHDHLGNTPLNVACLMGSLDSVQLLISYQADVNLPNHRRETPVFTAASTGHQAIMTCLIAAHADFNTSTLGCLTPLNMAAYRGDFPMVELLLTAGADPNSPCNEGETPIYKAARLGHTDCAVSLYRYGANVNIPPRDLRAPRTAVECARESGNWKLFFLLIPGCERCNTKNLEKAYESWTNSHLTSTSERMDEEAAKILADKRSLFVDQTYTIQELTNNSFSLWFFLLSSIRDVEGLEQKIAEYVTKYDFLAEAKDDNNRIAINVATVKNKEAMNSVLLWHGRYRIIDRNPEHISETCYVFKAWDELKKDRAGNPKKVALKLMRFRSHFLQEIETRKKQFDLDYVVNIITTHPKVEELSQEDWEKVEDVYETYPKYSCINETVSKAKAEQMFCITMPFADRNMCDSLKHERYAGRDLAQVKHIFIQIVNCVEHLHARGVLHGDLKPLNIIRLESRWKLIDLDASCQIGLDSVCSKTSTCYLPPEAIHCVDQQVAIVRSHANLEKHPNVFELLVAHPSFDIWSLGCILYQMCTSEVIPLFHGGRDDNVSIHPTDPDNLWVLAQWNSTTKDNKLFHVQEILAKNLISIMLQRDPLHRASIARILSHPFLTAKKVVRLSGDEAAYDVFISYRQSSDMLHAEILYHRLIKKGLKVWWDQKCLRPGEDWKDGFCAGLVNSKSFVCILSRCAINDPNVLRNNYSAHDFESECDNVLLEHRFALELRGLNYVDKIYPVFVGDIISEPTSPTVEYSDYFAAHCGPKASHCTVLSVEKELKEHMEKQALGTPLMNKLSVVEVLNFIMACQGYRIAGEREKTFDGAVEVIYDMVQEINQGTGTTGMGSEKKLEGEGGSLEGKTMGEGKDTVSKDTERSKLSEVKISLLQPSVSEKREEIPPDHTPASSAHEEKRPDSFKLPDQSLQLQLQLPVGEEKEEDYFIPNPNKLDSFTKEELLDIMRSLKDSLLGKDKIIRELRQAVMKPLDV